jgi:hypothetical protein
VSQLTKLATLNLTYGDIADLTPLRGLTQLRYLQLQGNEISDVSPLSGMSKLAGLSLNKIADPSPLAAPGMFDPAVLATIDLRNNLIADASSLAPVGASGAKLGERDLLDGRPDAPGQPDRGLLTVLGLAETAAVDRSGALRRRVPRRRDHPQTEHRERDDRPVGRGGRRQLRPRLRAAHARRPGGFERDRQPELDGQLHQGAGRPGRRRRSGDRGDAGRRAGADGRGDGDQQGVLSVDLTVTGTTGRTSTLALRYASSVATTPTSRVLLGSSDASTAIAVGDGCMLVADDEKSYIRLYDATRSGREVAQFAPGNVSGAELDFEASARKGDTVYWLGSQGNDKDGSYEASRNAIFVEPVYSDNPGAWEGIGEMPARITPGAKVRLITDQGYDVLYGGTRLEGGSVTGTENKKDLDNYTNKARTDEVTLDGPVGTIASLTTPGAFPDQAANTIGAARLVTVTNDGSNVLDVGQVYTEVVLDGGVIVEAGATDDVLDRPQVEYTRALLADTPAW